MSTYKKYMRGFLFAVVVFVYLIVNGCEKSASNTITGIWNVISDSTITNGATISYTVYDGNANDYFIFSANGTLYTKEGDVYDTVLCTPESDSTIAFDKIGVNINVIPQTGTYVLAGNTLRIVVVPDVIIPAFSYRRVINLKR
jgi:hypothetical protein